MKGDTNIACYQYCQAYCLQYRVLSWWKRNLFKITAGIKEGKRVLGTHGGGTDREDSRSVRREDCELGSRLCGNVREMAKIGAMGIGMWDGSDESGQQGLASSMARFQE